MRDPREAGSSFTLDPGVLPGTVSEENFRNLLVPSNSESL